MHQMPTMFVIALLMAVAAIAQDNPVFKKLSRAARKAPLAVAHRGASADCPENTIAAFRAAVAAKAEVVEFDVYQTVDGAWVCMHDSTCDRTTDAVQKFGRKKVRVNELTLAEVRTLDAGSWFNKKFSNERVPTLAEAIEAILPAVPMIERKGGDAAALAGELQRLEVIDRVLVQAFDWKWLAAVHAAEPRLLLGALGGSKLSESRHADLTRTGATLVHWNHRDLDIDTAAMVRSEGQLLCVYTVDSDVLLLGAAAIGCDLITTNRPARLAELRRRGLLRRQIRRR